MSDKEQNALKEWQQQLKKETQKLKGKQLSDQVATVRRKLEILKAVETKIKGDAYSEKVWKQEITKLEQQITELEQALEDKQMQYGRLRLLEKLTNHLDDIL